MNLLVFSKRADRIPAFLAIKTEAAMSEFSEFPPPDQLPGQDPRQNEIKYRRTVIHAAGRDAEDRN